MAMLLFTLDQLQQIEATRSGGGNEVGEVNQYAKMMYLNGTFWVLVLFIVVALVAAYKIAVDNEPDH